MAYTKVSIPRFEAGGAPTVKKATVILVDINDIDAEPAVTAVTVDYQGNIK